MYARKTSGAIVSCFVPKAASPSLGRLWDFTCVNYRIKSKLGFAAHNLNRPKVPLDYVSPFLCRSRRRCVPVPHHWFRPLPCLHSSLLRRPTVSPSHWVLGFIPKRRCWRTTQVAPRGQYKVYLYTLLWYDLVWIWQNIINAAEWAQKYIKHSIMHVTGSWMCKWFVLKCSYCPWV